MDKQRSFSFKPTRFLVFSFTISFSLIFLTFFSTWVIKANPAFRQETQLHFNHPSLNLTAQSLTSFTRNFSNEILVGAHFRKPVNTSEKEPTKVPHAVNGNLTGFSSVIGVNNSISTATHFKRSENATGFARDSVFRGRMRKENESEVTDKEIQRVEDVFGNSASTQELAFDHSVVKTQVSISVQEKSNRRVCDVTKGRWVYDESYPLYTNFSCPFIDEGFNCEANGRSDQDYMKWRWEPQDCDIPR